MAARSADPLGAALNMTPLDEKTQRHLYRVYTTLTIAVFLAAVGAIVEAAIASPALGVLASLAVFPALMWFYWQPRGGKNRPLAFYTFAFLDGMAAGPLLALAAAANPQLPLLAFVGCTVVFAGFSVSALFARRRSYLFLGSFLWTALWGLFMLGVVNMFTSKFYGLGLALYGGLLVMCGFVLYDTQLIVEKVSNGDNDHFSHALELLIDFIVIFKRLLLILLRNDQHRKEERDSRRRRKD